MPGIKVRVYHPDNQMYYIGTSIVAAAGSKTRDSTEYINYYGTNGTHYALGTQSKFLFGMMAHASGEFFLKSRVYFLAEIGFGYTYTYTVNNLPENNSGLLEIGFKLGYRY